MWTCPKCGSKVDREFEVCWHCGTAPDGTEDPNFVPADLEGPIDELPISNSPDLDFGGPSPGSDLVPCYQAYSIMEAKFLADQLSEAGIAAVSDAMDMQDALGGWSGNPRVYCREVDLAKADAFLQEYERRKAEHHPAKP